MSGFAGFCTFPDPSPDAADLLARLQHAPSHPGPATRSAPLVSGGGRAGLIAAQYACSDGDRLIVAFDGAIYNRDTLRSGLDATATALLPPQDSGDAELVLALYARYGASCIERLRGPFALTILDERGDGDGACVLARDPMGLRALYYYHDEPGGRLVFASAVRPLAASGIVPRQLDARGLYGFFRHGAVPEPFSLVAGVRALETGARLLWRAGQVTRERSRPSAPARTAPNDQELAKSLRASLLDSVEQHLADGAPQAVFVGGGIGSAVLLAMAREVGRERNLRALTLGFDYPPLDKTDLARQTAEYFGVPHTHLRLDRARARAWFDDYLPALDQPGVQGFPWFALCRFAREEGVGVALAATGLSEFFGDSVLHAQIKRLMDGKHRSGPLGSLFNWAWRAGNRSPSPPMLADFLTRPPTLPGAYAAIRGVHTAEESRAMVARFADPTGCADPAPDVDEFPTPDDEINALECQRLLRDQLLRHADAFGRAHGLELHLPFVDGRVAETIARIPAASRAGAAHLALVRAVPELPPWIKIKSANSGLRLPLEEWQAGEWGAAKPADGAGLRARRAWEQKWSLFLFRRWWRQVSSG